MTRASFPSHRSWSAVRRLRLARLDVRLSIFDWVQLLLVAWVGLSAVARFAVGVEFSDTPGTRVASPQPTTVEWMLHVVNNAMYVAVAFLVSRQFPLWRGLRRRSTLAFPVALIALHAIARGSMLYLDWHNLSPLRWGFFYYKTVEFIVYVCIAHGLLYGEHAHERNREAARLRAAMSEERAQQTRARLHALKMTWVPRFLTATLDAITETLTRDVAEAKRLLLGLSTVLRRVLTHLHRDVVRLEQEIELVRHVLHVEAMRRPALLVEWDVDEKSLESSIPQMTFVTMVYRALHRCLPTAPHRLKLTARMRQESIILGIDLSGIQEPDNPQFRYLQTHTLRSAEDHFPPLVDQSTALLTSRSAGRDRDPGPRSIATTQEDLATAPPDEALGRGRGFQLATYIGLIVFYSLFELFHATAGVAEGRIELLISRSSYVLASALYVALWWVSFAALAWILSERYPIRSERWARRFGLHAAAVGGLALLNAVLYFPLQRFAVVEGMIGIGLPFESQWGNVTIYVPLACIAHGFLYVREYQSKRLAELKLRRDLAAIEADRVEAELTALKAELNPHFLFNALHTVSSLMHAQPAAAQRVCRRLSALLDRLLATETLQVVTVQEEIEFIRLYMEIEEARFGEKLQIEYEIDPSTLDARIPHLMLQPLVENAVKHGLRPRGGRGRITILTERLGDALRLQVRDDGVGLTEAHQARGTGLANVRKRLQRLYAGAHSFRIGPAPDGGAMAEITIPFAVQSRTVAPPENPAARAAR